MGISLPFPPTSPAKARETVRSALAAFPRDVVDTATMLTSELVTNALVHGAGEARIVVDVGDGHVRVDVIDPDPTLDLRPLTVTASSEHGRGLAIVEALASEWGVEPRGGGKSVWFELHI